MHFFIKKIRTIDAIHLNVDLSFVVRLRWEQTQIKEALRRHGSTASLQGAVVETDELWMPDFSILNARRSSAEHLIAMKALRCTATAWIPHCR